MFSSNFINFLNICSSIIFLNFQQNFINFSNNFKKFSKCQSLIWQISQKILKFLKVFKIYLKFLHSSIDQCANIYLKLFNNFLKKFFKLFVIFFKYLFSYIFFEYVLNFIVNLLKIFNYFCKSFPKFKKYFLLPPLCPPPHGRKSGYGPGRK